MANIEVTLEKKSEAWSSISGKIAAIVLSLGAIATAVGGGASFLLDEVYLPRINSRQIIALDEKMGVVNSAVDSLKDVSSNLNKLITDFGRLGIDVSDLQKSHRALELKLERIDAQVDIIKDKK